MAASTATCPQRNVAFLGHVGVGKTAVAESILLTAKAVNRKGITLDGSSHFDFEPEEIKRGSTLKTAVFNFPYNKKSYSLIDTPGSSSFIVDTACAVRGADAVILVVGAVSGIKVQGEKGWAIAEEEGIARAIFVNELDKERASFESALETVASALELKPVIVHMPIGSEGDLKGVVDMISMKAYVTDKNGATTVGEIPEEALEAAGKAHDDFIERIAETNDDMLEKYLEGEEPTKEQALAAFKDAFSRGELVPVFAGSAETLCGIQGLLSAIDEDFPSPDERVPYKALEQKDDEEPSTIEINPDPDAPFAGLVFKTFADPYAGQISLVRVVSGHVDSDTTVFNPITDTIERVGKLHTQQGKEHQAVDSAGPGDIVAIAKLKETLTGHTLCSEQKPCKLQGITFPEGCISFAVEPKSKGDEDKILSAIEKITHEDPSIHVTRSASTHETIVTGMGKNHIDITLERIHRKFGVDIIAHAPKVPYRETIMKQAEAEGRHKKQTGGRGQFGKCLLRVKPKPRGQGFEFHNDIFGGAIPRNYIPAVEKGVVEAMQGGILAGFPMVDIDCTVYDGSYHAVDSSDMAFKLAASKGFKAAVEKAGVVLLEPVMHAEIIVPDEVTGDVIGDLNSRRGKVIDMQPKGHNQVIQAEVPLAEMLTYAPDLRSITADRGAFHMEFHGYHQVPGALTSKIVEEHKAEVIAEKAAH